MLANQQVIEHYECGTVRLKKEFETETEKLVCPRCRKELKELGTDYRLMGEFYKCFSCGDFFQLPYERFMCLECLKNFDLREAKRIEGIAIHEAVSQRVKELKTLQFIDEFIKRLGALESREQDFYAKVTGSFQDLSRRFGSLEETSRSIYLQQVSLEKTTSHLLSEASKKLDALEEAIKAIQKPTLKEKAIRPKGRVKRKRPK